MMMLSNLPLELEWEILSKVPATSLTQLRSTCKRWYVLFKDPIFIRKNMGRATTQMIVKMKGSVYSVSINLPNKSIEFKCKLKSLQDPQRVYISGIFHCDGLLLCTMRGNNHVHVVWNPCTGQTRWIPPPPSSINCCGYFLSCDYALGYDSNKSCYKILRTCFCNPSLSKLGKVDLEIYEFRSNSWRVLDDITQKWVIISRRVSLKGNSYWIAWDIRDYPYNKFLLEFDFKRERFESLSLPSECNNNDRQHVNMVLSAVGQEKLSVLVEKFDSLEMKIWVTDINKIEYSLVVDSGIIMRQGMKRVDSFLVDEENKRVVCCGDNEKKEEGSIIYIVGHQDSNNNNVCQQVHDQQSPQVLEWNRPYLLSYVPSLVQIQ